MVFHIAGTLKVVPHQLLLNVSIYTTSFASTHIACPSLLGSCDIYILFLVFKTILSGKGQKVRSGMQCYLEELVRYVSP